MDGSREKGSCTSVTWHNVLTLELSDVTALFSRDSRSFRVTGVDISVSISTAFADAFWKASEMVVGCMPWRMRAVGSGELWWEVHHTAKRRHQAWVFQSMIGLVLD